MGAVYRESLVGSEKSSHSRIRMEQAAQFSIEQSGDSGVRLVLSGQLTLANISPVEPQLRRINGPVTEIDLAGVDDIDTVGAEGTE